ncbi:uncharacterized protein [Leptinotarsa decemlineata]|uniref:uncharacterized protein n=1 Tax=Leptinotarsa decemlineata TaxID=7539 RepID=UPI000C252529|nr:uncharacterized protein LOC111514282 [Leptinotarsa decemlineata]
MLKVYFILSFFTIVAESHPTMYKFNENKILEPDLVPVSSTVIPLPVYQVGFGLKLPSTLENEKPNKPEGPVHLITVHTKHKANSSVRSKTSDYPTADKV